MPWDVIWGVHMGEHGLGVKFRGEGRVAGEDSTPEVFRGVSKRGTQVMTSLGDKEMFLATEEAMI